STMLKGCGRGTGPCAATVAAIAAASATKISGRMTRTLRPFSLPHDRFDGAVARHAVDVEIAGANHEIDVYHAPVAAGTLELFVRHRLAVGEREFVGRPEGDVTGGVFIEERVVKEESGLRDRRAMRNERQFTQPRRAFVGVDELPQHRVSALGLDAHDTPS